MSAQTWNMLMSTDSVKTFENYAKQIFIPFVFSQYQTATRLDLVWDHYLPGSLKIMTRENSGKGVGSINSSVEMDMRISFELMRTSVNLLVISPRKLK